MGEIIFRKVGEVPRHRNSVEEAKRLFAENESLAYWYFNKYVRKDGLSPYEQDSILSYILEGLYIACLYYDPKIGAISTIAYTWMANRAKTFFAERKRRGCNLLRDADNSCIDVEDKSRAQDPFEESDREILFRKLLSGCSERMRRYMVKYYIDGKTYREIGQEEGVSKQAAQLHCRVSLQLIRRRLKDRGITEEQLRGML